MTRLAFTAPLLLALAGAAVPVAARASGRADTTDYSSVIHRIEERVPAAMQRGGVSGAAIALVNVDGVIWSGGFGFLDTTRTTPVTDSTLFSVQSISKTYTAVAVLRATSLGLLQLDDPLRRSVPEFTIRSRFGTGQRDAITIRHLLAHRASLPHETSIGSNFDDTDATFEAHIQSIFGTWLRCPVGERFGYSNLGIDLAGYALQRVVGNPFSSVVDSLVFAPLGMRHSTFDQAAAYRLGDVAAGHIGDRELPRTAVPMIPAGGMYSTARDMGGFVSVMLRGGEETGIARPLLDAMTTPQFPVAGQTGGYGLGLYVVRAFGAWRFSHEGGGYGYSAEQRWIPAYGVGVVVLTNQERGALGPAMAAGILQLMLQAKLGPVPADSTPPAPLAIDRAVGRIESLVGTYRSPTGMVKFTAREGALVRIRDADTLALVRIAERRFAARGMTTTFDLDKAGRVRGATVLDVQFRANGAEYWPRNDGPSDPPGPSRSGWSGHVGDYEGHSYGMPVRTKIYLRNGYLYTSWGGGQRLEEYGEGFFTPDGETVEFPPGAVVIGNRRFVRIAMER